LVHVPHEDAGRMTHQRMWLRYFPGLGFAFCPQGLVVNHRDFDMYICAPCVFLRLRKSAYPMKEHLSKLLWSSIRHNDFRWVG
jgi:hypothetical protein